MGPRSDFSKPCQGAAEKSANATRCCCLARGFKRVGMSTVEAVNRKISWLFCFASHGCTVSARSVLSMSDDVGRCIALQSVPFFASGEQCQAELCLHFRVGILEQFQKSRHGEWWVRLLWPLWKPIKIEKPDANLKVDDTRLFIGYRICAQNSSKVLVLSNSRVRDVELNNSTILSKAGLKNFISASVMPIIRTKCTVFFFH